MKELEPFLNKKHPLRALKRKTQRSNSPPVTVRNKLIPNVYPMLSTCSRTHFDRSEGSEEKLDFQARMILQWGQWVNFLIDWAIPAQKMNLWAPACKFNMCVESRLLYSTEEMNISIMLEVGFRKQNNLNFFLNLFVIHWQPVHGCQTRCPIVPTEKGLFLPMMFNFKSSSPVLYDRIRRYTPLLARSPTWRIGNKRMRDALDLGQTGSKPTGSVNWHL